MGVFSSPFVFAWGWSPTSIITPRGNSYRSTILKRRASRRVASFDLDGSETVIDVFDATVMCQSKRLGSACTHLKLGFNILGGYFFFFFSIIPTCRFCASRDLDRCCTSSIEQVLHHFHCYRKNVAASDPFAGGWSSGNEWFNITSCHATSFCKSWNTPCISFCE